MQIAGRICKVCERGIVFAREGKICPNCGAAMHLLCEPKTDCGVCGVPFQGWEPPEADPMGQALVPPAMRTGRSVGPGFAIGCAAVFVILLFLAYCFAYSLFKRGM
jgi:hypothetical protein